MQMQAIQLCLSLVWGHTYTHLHTYSRKYMYLLQEQCVFFSSLVLLLHSHSDNFIDCKHICWSSVGYSFAGKLCAHICSIIRAAVIFGAQNANTHTRIGRMKNKHILYGSIHSRSKRGDDQKQASKQESNWWIQCDSGDKKLPKHKTLAQMAGGTKRMALQSQLYVMCDCMHYSNRTVN